MADPGRQGAGEEAESSISWSKGSQERTVFQAARRRFLKSTSTLTHFFQEGHTYSNLLIVLLHGSSIFKLPQH